MDVIMVWSLQKFDTNSVGDKYVWEQHEEIEWF